MKLKKIKDVRIGQIYQKENRFYLIIDKINYKLRSLYEVKVFDIEGNYIINKIIDNTLDENANIAFDYFTLIGFLEITHKYCKTGRIFKIYKNDFEVDDILEKDNIKYIITNVNDDVIETLDENLYQHSFEKKYINENEFKKVGTLGINYELINNNL